MKFLAITVAIAAVVALTAAATTEDKVSYDGFKVYRVVPQNMQQLQALRNMEESNRSFSFWTEVAGIGQAVDIMVAPHLRYEFSDFAKLAELEYSVFMDNVQEFIDNEQPTDVRSTTKDLSFLKYNTLAEIHAWLRELVSSNPGKVSLINAGTSYEGRELLGVKVSFNSANEKRAIFIEGGIHAREWISPATVAYILNELLTSTDSAVRRLAENYDWYVFPNFNPDGYVYTHEKDRMWRKTRKPYGLCYGSDPNRNWGYKWMHGGASSNACTETYAGTAAFSCPENKQMSEYIDSIADKLVSYLAFHSYSQLLLIPFGHQDKEYPSNYNELMSIGKVSINALAKRFGTIYKVGNIVDIIYVASGGSMDWVKGFYPNVRIPYTYELRDTGRYGFILPANQIIPSGEETLDSIVAMFEEAEKIKLY